MRILFHGTFFSPCEPRAPGERMNPPNDSTACPTAQIPRVRLPLPFMSSLSQNPSLPTHPFTSPVSLSYPPLRSPLQIPGREGHRHHRITGSPGARGGARGMEPAERVGSGTTLGKRQRSRVLPRSASMVTVPSAAKQGRQERVGDVPSSSSSSSPAGSADMGAGGGGEPPRGYFSAGYYFAAAETAAFLKACGLCNRRLGPGHDTFIYRGEVAFCSQECREQQIEYDEHMEQTCSLISIKDAPSVSGASGNDQSGSKGETVAAA